MAASRSFGQQRKLNPSQRSELFQARRQRQQKLNWAEVDRVTLLTALATAMGEGATLSFAPAQGGIGVTMRVYRGEYADTEFAGSPQELEELLNLLIDGLSSGSEDVRELMRLQMGLAVKPQK